MKSKIKTEIDLQKIQIASSMFNKDDALDEAKYNKKSGKEDVEEGNEFTKAAAKAVIDGEEEFEFNGKTYKATIDKKAAKAILGIEEALEEGLGIDFKKVSDDNLKKWLEVFAGKNKRNAFGTDRPWDGFKDDVKDAKREAKKRGVIWESNLTEAIKAKKLTIDAFFTAYFGTKNWAKDSEFKDQIGMMNLGNNTISDLIKNKNKKVEVVSRSNRFGSWTTSFNMGDYTIEVESMDPVTEFA